MNFVIFKTTRFLLFPSLQFPSLPACGSPGFPRNGSLKEWTASVSFPAVFRFPYETKILDPRPRSRIKYDFIFVDIFQPAEDGAHVNPPIFVSESFFELLRRTTKDDGVAVMNMHPVRSEADRKEKERAALKRWRNVTFAPFTSYEDEEDSKDSFRKQYFVMGRLGRNSETEELTEGL